MNGENIGRGLLAEVCDRQLFRTTSHRFRPQRSDTTTTRESESRLKWWFPIILCSVTMFLVPLRSLFRSSCSSLCVVSFIHWLSLFGVWSVCPFGIPGTTELIYLNPRNIPIPQYHRLSVGTGAHSHHWWHFHSIFPFHWFFLYHLTKPSDTLHYFLYRFLTMHSETQGYCRHTVFTHSLLVVYFHQNKKRRRPRKGKVSH